jgi:2-polyprenyl-3-methyl-5-hydroxy-6-metoxy-1,4-benzoquinol methylase
MNRLEAVPELLDGVLDDADLRGNLRDLGRVNRWLGGVSLSFRAIKSAANADDRMLSVLDIGTGDAELPKQLFRHTAYGPLFLELTASDIRSEIVALARNNAGRYRVTVKLNESHQIDEADQSFDVVHASMVLHHLDPHDAAQQLREMARVATRAVIINDLDRSKRWLLGARLLSRVLTRNRYTRNDAPLSVQRAYRPSEVIKLAASAELTVEELFWARPRYRYALVFRHSSKPELRDA